VTILLKLLRTTMLGFVTLLSGLSTPLFAGTGDPITPAALTADLDLILKTIAERHPDIAHSTSRAALTRAANTLRGQIKEPVSQAEAWMLLAQLNPVMADGHLFVGLPDWRGRSTASIAAGAKHFPFEVKLDQGGLPIITALLGGGATPLAGRRILRIGAHDARSLSRAMLKRGHGDTPTFRASLVADRWWLFLAQVMGQPDSYTLRIEGQREPLLVRASGELPAALLREAAFDRQFSCLVGSDKSAVLTLNTFAWDDKAQFLTFTRDCFARIKAASVQKLVIDISANGGGDDDFWKEGILHYIAARSYRHGSTYRKRERSGEVTQGSIESEVAPALDEPLRYRGDLAVHIGPQTYSSAVLLANVVRDYGFGSLVGTGKVARTRQSGGVQSVTLPNTGLVLFYPRFVLDPPARSAPIWLQPTAERLER
jgi:hypothetical protein